MKKLVMHLASEVNVTLQHIHSTQDTASGQEVLLPLIPLVLDASRQIIDALPLDYGVQSVCAATGSQRLGNPECVACFYGL